MREGPDGAGNLADRHDVARAQHAIEITLELGVPQGQLQPEGHRLGMDAVRAPDHRRQAVLWRALTDGLHQRRDVLDDETARVTHLERLRGVDARRKTSGRSAASARPAPPARPRLS